MMSGMVFTEMGKAGKDFITVLMMVLVNFAEKAVLQFDN